MTNSAPHGAKPVLASWRHILPSFLAKLTARSTEARIRGLIEPAAETGSWHGWRLDDATEQDCAARLGSTAVALVAR